MKIKNIFWAAMLMSSVAVMAQNGYNVTGNVAGLQTGDTVDVYEIGHHFSKPFKSIAVQDGRFSFSGNQADPRGIVLVARNYSGGYRLILDNHSISINGSVEKKGNDANWKVSTTGNDLTNEYYKKMQVRDSLDNAYEAYHKRYDEAKAKIAQELKGVTDSTIIKARYKEAYDNMSKEEHEFFSGVEKAYSRLISQNKNTWWGPFLMESIMSYFTPDNRSTYEQFSPEAKASYYGQMVGEELYPKDLTGKAVPDFTVTVNGKKQTLKQLLQGKKYALIDFWASWCVPCRREIPNLKKLYAQYAAKGFQIISISTDKKRDQWQRALAQEKMPWVQTIDETGVADKYKVVAIPATFLVDANGHLVADDLRGEDLAAKLAELLK